MSKSGKPRISKPKPRKPGFLKGKIWIADNFDDPLPEEMMRVFRGEDTDEDYLYPGAIIAHPTKKLANARKKPRERNRRAS